MKYYNNQTIALLNPYGLVSIVPIVAISAMPAISPISAAKGYKNFFVKVSQGKLFHNFIFAALCVYYFPNQLPFIIASLLDTFWSTYHRGCNTSILKAKAAEPLIM